MLPISKDMKLKIFSEIESDFSKFKGKNQMWTLNVQFVFLIFKGTNFVSYFQAVIIVFILNAYKSGLIKKVHARIVGVISGLISYESNNYEHKEVKRDSNFYWIHQINDKTLSVLIFSFIYFKRLNYFSESNNTFLKSYDLIPIK